MCTCFNVFSEVNVDVSMNITLMIDDKLKAIRDDKLKAIRGKQLTSKRKQ